MLRQENKKLLEDCVLIKQDSLEILMHRHKNEQLDVINRGDAKAPLWGLESVV